MNLLLENKNENNKNIGNHKANKKRNVSNHKKNNNNLNMNNYKIENSNSHKKINDDLNKRNYRNSKSNYRKVQKNNKYKIQEKNKGIGRKVISGLGTLILVGFVVVLFLLYGPFNKFREWYITTAMTTMSHQYLATIFYSSDTINDVLDKNKVVEVNSITDPSLVTITASTKNTSYANQYEREILEKDPNHPNYKIIPVKSGSYSGYLAVVYDPSKVKTLVTNKVGQEGQYLTEMATNANATIAINGGVFTGDTSSSEDLSKQELKYGGAGGSPYGITIANNKVVTQTKYTGAGGVVGFTSDNKLILGKMTVNQAKSMKVRDAVTCGPFLIINGKKSEIKGNGGWGTAPRTAIGQRKDGIVLMLVVDGRRATMPGATMEDLMNIMETCGAYNASALDGGTSTAMVENGKLLNDPIDSTGAHNTRPIATGFGAIF